MTIKELKEIIKDLPDDTPIRSEGSDFGGYDCVTGYKVKAEVLHRQDGWNKPILHICYDGR